MKLFRRRDDKEKQDISAIAKPLVSFSCTELVRKSVDLMAECYRVLAEARLRELEVCSDDRTATRLQPESSENFREKLRELARLLEEIAQKCVE